MTLKSRLEALEAQRNTALSILITYDGGETFKLCGTDQVLTRAEVDALPGQVRVIEVVYTDERINHDTTSPIAKT